MDQTACPFCEDFKKTKEDWTYFQNRSPRRSVQTAKQEYRVALIVESYCEDVDWCTGIVTHQHMDLNFCPVCGTKF